MSCSAFRQQAEHGQHKDAEMLIHWLCKLNCSRACRRWGSKVVGLGCSMRRRRPELLLVAYLQAWHEARADLCWVLLHMQGVVKG